MNQQKLDNIERSYTGWYTLHTKCQPPTVEENKSNSGQFKWSMKSKIPFLNSFLDINKLVGSYWIPYISMETKNQKSLSTN